MEEFFKKLEKLQQEPVHVRKRILHLTVGSIFALVVLVWFTTFSTDRSNSVKSVKAGEDPFHALVDMFKGFGGAVGKAGSIFKDESSYSRKKVDIGEVEKLKAEIAKELAQTASTSSDLEATSTNENGSVYP